MNQINFILYINMEKSIKIILVVIIIIIIGIILFLVNNNNVNKTTNKSIIKPKVIIKPEDNSDNSDNSNLDNSDTSKPLSDAEISALLENQQLRTCGSTGIPPCKEGGTLTNIPDPQYVISNYNPAFSETIDGEIVATMVPCCTYEYDSTISDPEIIDAVVVGSLAALMNVMLNVVNIADMSYDAARPLLDFHAKTMSAKDAKAARTNINNNIENIKNTGTKNINKSLGTQKIDSTGKINIKQPSQIKMEVEHFTKGMKVTKNNVEIRSQQTKAFKNARIERLNTMNDAKTVIQGTKNGPKILIESGLKPNAVPLKTGAERAAAKATQNLADDAVINTIDNTVSTGSRVASSSTAKLATQSTAKIAGKIATSASSALIKGAIASLFTPLSIVLGILELVLALIPTVTTYKLPNDTWSLDYFLGLRKEIIVDFNKSYIEQGLPLPRISGPLDHLPFYPTGQLDIYNPKSVQEIHQLLQTEYCVSFISNALEKIDNFYTFSPADRIAIVDKLSTVAMKFFDTPTGQTYLDQRSCDFVKGLNINGMCSWPNKEKCESSYNWKKIVNKMYNPSLYENDTDVTYVEWRPAYKVDPATATEIVTEIEPPSACIQVSPNLKYFCPTGSEYKQHIQACSYPKSYCCERGMSYYPNNGGFEIGTCDSLNRTDTCTMYGCKTSYSSPVGCN